MTIQARGTGLGLVAGLLSSSRVLGVLILLAECGGEEREADDTGACGLDSCMSVDYGVRWCSHPGFPSVLNLPDSCLLS